MLGIIIGIASVASVVALGIGGREKVLSDIRALGPTLWTSIRVWLGDEKAASIKTLTANDALALSSQPYVDAVTAAGLDDRLHTFLAESRSRAPSMVSAISTSRSPLRCPFGRYLQP